MKTAILFLVLCLGCSPVARSVPPQISGSHSQLTASQYDDAETAFSGGLAPMPVELQAAADAECQRLLNKRNTGRAIVYGLGGLTGVGGVATLIPKDATDEEKERWNLGLGIVTLGTATATTILGALIQGWTDEYERRCVSETPASPAPGIDAPARPVLDFNAGAGPDTETDTETGADGGTE